MSFWFFTPHIVVIELKHHHNEFIMWGFSKAAVCTDALVQQHRAAAVVASGGRQAEQSRTPPPPCPRVLVFLRLSVLRCPNHIVEIITLLTKNVAGAVCTSAQNLTQSQQKNSSSSSSRHAARIAEKSPTFPLTPVFLPSCDALSCAVPTSVGVAVILLKQSTVHGRQSCCCQ